MPYFNFTYILLLISLFLAASTANHAHARALTIKHYLAGMQNGVCTQPNCAREYIPLAIAAGAGDASLVKQSYKICEEILRAVLSGLSFSVPLITSLLPSSALAKRLSIMECAMTLAFSARRGDMSSILHISSSISLRAHS